MDAKKTAVGFGLIVVGNEILDGRRRDAHFTTVRTLLTERDLTLTYCLVLPDEPGTLTQQLRWAMARSEPFFCCGGIGGTPDDHTRDCAGAAAGVGVEYHEEGLRILRSRFGKEATPGRMKMVLFPEGAGLVPNPINQVPGFYIRNGYFLPGFPEMAGPMMAWILDTWYARGEERGSASLVLVGAREADMVDLMERFVRTHPEVSFSSLPGFTATGTELHLGLSGPVGPVREGLSDLRAELDKAGIPFAAPN